MELTITTIAVLAATVQEATQAVYKYFLAKALPGQSKEAVKVITAFVLAVGISFLFQLDFTAELELGVELPAWAGYLATGVAGFLGSRITHDILDAVRSLRSR